MVPFTVLEPRVAAELETLADTCRIELLALSRHPEQGYPSARDDIKFYTQQLKAFEKALANWLRGVRPVQTPSGAWLIPSASKPGEIHHCEKVDHLWICGPTCKASTFHWHGALMTAIESLAGQMTAIYHENDAYPDVGGYTPAPEVDDEPAQQDWREAEQQAQPPRRPTNEERVLIRARALMQNKKARGWSHAIALAADTLPRNDE